VVEGARGRRTASAFARDIVGSTGARASFRQTREDPVQYLLLLHVEEGGWARLTPAEQADGMAAYARYNKALAAAGALVSTGRLEPSSGALAVRTIGGKLVTMDGPFAETKEQIGGYYLIESPDLEAALAWARRCPAAGHGTVEVRQVL
jgi:hypothetical protein